MIWMYIWCGMFGLLKHIKIWIYIFIILWRGFEYDNKYCDVGGSTTAPTKAYKINDNEYYDDGGSTTDPTECAKYKDKNVWMFMEPPNGGNDVCMNKLDVEEVNKIEFDIFVI